jgi:hypothetical protein
MKSYKLSNTWTYSADLIILIKIALLVCIDVSVSWTCYRKANFEPKLKRIKLPMLISVKPLTEFSDDWVITDNIALDQKQK